jgi:hypothetical protein
MKKELLSIIVLIIVILLSFSGCLGSDDSGDDNDYFKETYHRINLSFKIDCSESNESSYVIIPAPLQNGLTLEFAEFQNNDELNNYSYEFIETEYGDGLKISPIPENEFLIWFACEPYSAQAPFELKQTEQFLKPEYPGLSMWEADTESGYYWFYSSENTTGISYKYEYSDCYALSDKGGTDGAEPAGWIRTKYMRVQEEMPM